MHRIITVQELQQSISLLQTPITKQSPELVKEDQKEGKLKPFTANFIFAIT